MDEPTCPHYVQEPDAEININMKDGFDGEVSLEKITEVAKAMLAEIKANYNLDRTLADVTIRQGECFCEIERDCTCSGVIISLDITIPNPNYSKEMQEYGNFLVAQAKYEDDRKKYDNYLRAVKDARTAQRMNHWKERVDARIKKVANDDTLSQEQRLEQISSLMAQLDNRKGGYDGR